MQVRAERRVHGWENILRQGLGFVHVTNPKHVGTKSAPQVPCRDVDTDGEHCYILYV
jgi:hypothetical protein